MLWIHSVSLPLLYRYQLWLHTGEQWKLKKDTLQRQLFWLRFRQFGLERACGCIYALLSAWVRVNSVIWNLLHPMVDMTSDLSVLVVFKFCIQLSWYSWYSYLNHWALVGFFCLFVCCCLFVLLCFALFFTSCQIYTSLDCWMLRIIPTNKSQQD